jgi:hypothetical protein
MFGRPSQQTGQRDDSQSGAGKDDDGIGFQKMERTREGDKNQQEIEPRGCDRTGGTLP